MLDCAVALEGSRIVGVFPAAEIEAGAAVDHYPDGTVLPGLIDAHCHLTLVGDGRTYEEMCQDPDEMMALISLQNLQRHLASGVTTLRDNGGRNRVTFVVREAMRRGYFEGPRLLLAGRPITPSNGHFSWCNGVADGEVEIRAAVHRLVVEGADHIKIMASGGGTAGTIPYEATYTTAELAAAVNAAHALGRLTTAHCRAKDSMIHAVEAGLDCIEHAEFLVRHEIAENGGGVASDGVMEYDPAVTEQIVDSGAFVSFTAQAGGYASLLGLRAAKADSGLTREDESRRVMLERYFDMKMGILSRLLDDGMLRRLVISTDAGPSEIEFGRLSYGLKLAVSAGMSPGEAIASATRTAARACGIETVVGTIESAKEADLVVVRGDPTRDIGRIADVTAVYKGGRIVAPLRPIPDLQSGHSSTDG